MGFNRVTYLLMITVLAADVVVAQEISSKPVRDSIPYIRVIDINKREFQRHDTVWVYSGICKTLKVSQYLIGKNNVLKQASASNKSIVVHGNIFYDFFFRSYADTPYYQRDFRQHTIRTSLNISVKDKYVFRFNGGIRVSNSPWFRNFFDGGLQFDQSSSLAKMKREAENKVAGMGIEKPELEMTEAALKEQLKKYNDLKRSLNGPDLTQLLIEERERNYYNSLKKQDPDLKKELNTKKDAVETKIKDSIENKIKGFVSEKMEGTDSAKNKVARLRDKADSTENKVSRYISEKKTQLDSLEKSIARLQHKADSLKNSVNKETGELKQKIAKATNTRELKKVLVDNNIPEDKKNKLDKVMADVKSIGIGRSFIDYSELTVNSVSLTGLSIEYNPKLYAAFAAGKIDYGFRDFMGRNKTSNKQQLLAGRVGWGNKDKMAVIVTAYTGKKYNYGSVLSDTVSSYINVAGYSVEGTIKKNENVGITAEVAKSTRPVTGRLNDTKEAGSLFRFSDHSNQAISIKGQTIIPETNTRLSGFFRKSGENFQSFSLFTYNTDQTAWSLKADQSFLKNRVNLLAMLRRNDFTNPFTEKTFKTKTVFTSVQLNIRVPKWPTISAGYHPGSQLYFIDRDRIRENVYYILNGSLIYTYSAGGTRMTSSAIYNQYYSKGTDSGFISYKGKSYMISHSLLFRTLQLGGNFIYTDQRELRYYTVEANADYFPKSFFKVGIGGKYNRTASGKVYWGERAQLTLEIKKLGGLQMQYEKSFLPTVYQTLFPVETGRISWFKYF
jgi:hypothetical protein